MLEVQTKLGIFEDSMWGYHIRIPEDISRQFIDGLNRRIICHFPQSISIHCALLPSAGEFYILVNKKIREQLNLNLGSPIKVNIEKDTSKYGMPMPEELQESLLQNREAQHFFEKLTAGKQRTLIYIVSKVKNTQSRLNKAMAIIHHLCEEEGEINFERLNDLIKEYNNRYKL